MSEKPDPTKEPEFQKVIRHFVTTPHKPHKPLGDKKSPTEVNHEKSSPSTSETKSDQSRER
jgi:hypothetical protein